MILKALCDYYDRLLNDPASEISPPGYTLEKISYVLVIDSKGRLVTVDDIRVTGPKKPVPRNLVVPASFKRPGTGSKPFFLWDKTSYAVGLGKQADRVEQNHRSFVERHRRELAGTEDEGLRALLVFLEGLQSGSVDGTLLRSQGDDFLDTNVVFRLDGELCYLHERPAARQRCSISRAASGQEEEVGCCLVTGGHSQLARVHPAIKGIRGTQNAETSMVAFNLESSRSYGKSQGANAPVSVWAAEAYTTALNHLLRSRRQRMDIGDANVVYWAQAADVAQAHAAEAYMTSLLHRGDDEAPGTDDAQETQRLHDTLEWVREGRPRAELAPGLRADTQIFVLGLAPSTSRLSVRYWETETLRAFAERLSWHDEDLRLEPVPWRRPPSIWRLSLAAAPTRGGRASKEDVPPQLAGELTRAILTGARYPYSLLATLLMRLRADGDEQAFGLRAALIKAVLSRAQRLGQDVYVDGGFPVSLDSSNAAPGYVLGRLFWVLEHIQRAALGKQINATIRDRYYGAASATPQRVFPVLLRNAQHHLGQLRRKKPGYAVSLEKQLGETMNLLQGELPKNLRMEAQGQFAIGYYHQKNVRFEDGSEVEDPVDTPDSEGEIE